MAIERAPRSLGLQAMHDQFTGDDPERIASYERARADADIAQHIYDMRTEAGLTRRELAARVGTTASAISQLEVADRANRKPSARAGTRKKPAES